MTKRKADMTPHELEVLAASNARRNITGIRRRLTPQDHLEMVLLYDVGLWSLEAVSHAYGVSLKTLRNARAAYPAVHIAWRGTT